MPGRQEDKTKKEDVSYKSRRSGHPARGYMVCNVCIFGFKGASTSKVIGARNEMMMDDYDGQMIFGDLVGLKLPDIRFTGEEKPRKKPHPGNLSRPGCEPGPAGWHARMLPLVPQWWTVTWWTKRGLGRFFSRLLPLSSTTNFIPPFLHTHRIHFVSFNFISPYNGATGLVGRHPCHYKPSI